MPTPPALEKEYTGLDYAANNGRDWQKEVRRKRLWIHIKFWLIVVVAVGLMLAGGLMLQSIRDRIDKAEEIKASHGWKSERIEAVDCYNSLIKKLQSVWLACGGDEMINLIEDNIK